MTISKDDLAAILRVISHDVTPDQIDSTFDAMTALNAQTPEQQRSVILSAAIAGLQAEAELAEVKAKLAWYQKTVGEIIGLLGDAP